MRHYWQGDQAKPLKKKKGLSALVLPMAAPGDGAPPLPHLAWNDVAPAEQEARAAAHGVVYGPWQVRACDFLRAWATIVGEQG